MHGRSWKQYTMTVMCNQDDCDQAAGDIWIDESQQMYNDVVKKHVVLKRSQEICKTKEVRKESQSPQIQTFQLEATKLPRFSGDIRDYAHFRCDFQKYVQPNVPESVAAYTLKSCLSRNPAHKVRNEDDISSMWKVLDENYADPAMVADVIMDDISMIRPFENGETHRFTEFVDKLEDGYSDLCKLGLQRELTMTSSVSIVEQKLSPEMKTRWSRLVVCPDSTVDRSDKFTSLLEFLQTEKRTIDYRCAALRLNGPEYVQGTVQHVDASAVTTSVRQRRDSDQPITNTCLLHGDGEHRTEDCVQYLFKTVDQRLALLRNRRACWTCLRVGHQCSECGVKRVCGENGCTRRHHRTLHKTRINVEQVSHIVCEEIQSVTERQCEEPTMTHSRNRTDNRLSTISRHTEEVTGLDKRSELIEQRLADQEIVFRNQLKIVHSENLRLKADNVRLSIENRNLTSTDNQSRRVDTTTSEGSDTYEAVDLHAEHSVTPVPSIQVARHTSTFRQRAHFPFVYQAMLCSFVMVTFFGVTNAHQCYRNCDSLEQLDTSKLIIPRQNEIVTSPCLETVDERYITSSITLRTHCNMCIVDNRTVIYTVVFVCGGECFVHITKCECEYGTLINEI